MNVLIVGAGGREHALAWAVAASPLCNAVYCAPGNAGIAEIAQCRDVAPTDTQGLINLCRDEAIEFVIIGPEQPLVAGVADALRQADIRVFGPGAKAARLEGSKGWMKDFCTRHAIPTPAYRRFSDPDRARNYIDTLTPPLVIKTDGLAAGKGVTVAQDMTAAHDALTAAMVDRRFGAAGQEIIVEEYLEGEEVSFFALLDGDNALALSTAQDHKRVGEGDQGPNTGGMGSYSPAVCCDDAMEERIMAEIIHPVLHGMKAEGHPYQGVLFAGLMMVNGTPRLLEYNVRFGDPECQVLMMRLRSDVLTALLTTQAGGLHHFDLRWSEDTALCVVMAAQGYPGPYAKGEAINGLETMTDDPDMAVFHAGTTRDDQGVLRSAGGRVLGITAQGRDMATARAKAYAGVDKIIWPGGFCRRDIGHRALARQHVGAGQTEDNS